MSFIRMTAIAAAATILATVAATAGPISLSRPQGASPDRQIEQVRYRHGGAFPAAIIGGILGGALSGGCYFNDCGYGYDGGYGYGGGYGGGGGRGGHGGRGGGGHGGGHAGGHAGGGHGGHR
jgi:hypothetical protein